MPSVAELIRMQTSKPRQKTIVKVPDPPRAKINLPSRNDAFYNFMDDRNYSDNPTERNSVWDRSTITEILEKEQPDDYIKGVPNQNYTPLSSAGQQNVELKLSDLSSYSLLRQTGVK